MGTKITDKEYEKILKFYKKPIPKSKRLLRKEAEKILSQKLCRCIKKVGLADEQRSISICTRSVINTKGFTRGRFKCKKGTSITLKKNKKNKTRRKKKNN
jgi:hypothetical protein